MANIAMFLKSPMQSLIVDSCSKALLSGSTTFMDNLMKASAGAFNLYQLITIPVEIFTQILTKHIFGMDEIQAYGTSKIAAMLTSTGIGFL